MKLFVEIWVTWLIAAVILAPIVGRILRGHKRTGALMAETPKEILERAREGLRVLSEGAQEPVVKVSAKMLLRDLDRLEMTEGYATGATPICVSKTPWVDGSSKVCVLLTIKPEPDHE